MALLYCISLQGTLDGQDEVPPPGCGVPVACLGPPAWAAGVPDLHRPAPLQLSCPLQNPGTSAAALLRRLPQPPAGGTTACPMPSMLWQPFQRRQAQRWQRRKHSAAPPAAACTDLALLHTAQHAGTPAAWDCCCLHVLAKPGFALRCVSSQHLTTSCRQQHWIHVNSTCTAFPTNPPCLLNRFS